VAACVWPIVWLHSQLKKTSMPTRCSVQHRQGSGFTLRAGRLRDLAAAAVRAPAEREHHSAKAEPQNDGTCGFNVGGHDHRVGESGGAKQRTEGAARGGAARCCCNTARRDKAVRQSGTTRDETARCEMKQHVAWCSAKKSRVAQACKAAQQ
jgi:hypothetical protein